jgi:AAA ATPase domain/AAA domain, putative AbiEii toxin, Type IV TA system
MLTALEIENFKGIAARQRIELAPLTLLFGANSAGKSTILQALLYLHELMERGTADIDRTELGGSVLELGGFARLVHRHEDTRAIILRVEFATPGSIERFDRDSFHPFADVDDQVESAWVELTVRFRTTPTFRGPLVERAVIGVNKDTEPLVWLETGASLREGEPLLARVNLGHSLISTEALDITSAWEQAAVPEDAVRRFLSAEGAGFGLSSGQLMDGSGFSDGRSLPVFAVVRSRLSALPPSDEPLQVFPMGDEDLDENTDTCLQVRAFLEMVVLGTTAQLASFLRKALYIGPLRTLPPGGFLYERPGRITSWADGLAAWDLLLTDRFDLVERTNTWLKRLSAGCQVVVQQLFDRGADAEDLSASHVDKTVRRLLLDTGGGSFVLPSEVGAGISQIIPVIVAALEGRSVFSLVEQPEIHVHPAIQVGLGDLLIDAVAREANRRTLLVETHSEHLMLRLLRRIRETTERELPEGAPSFTADNLSVLYVENQLEGVRVQRLRVDERGEFLDRWPKGFFEERAEELF